MLLQVNSIQSMLVASKYNMHAITVYPWTLLLVAKKYPERGMRDL